MCLEPDSLDLQYSLHLLPGTLDMLTSVGCFPCLCNGGNMVLEGLLQA